MSLGRFGTILEPGCFGEVAGQLQLLKILDWSWQSGAWWHPQEVWRTARPYKMREDWGWRRSQVVGCFCLVTSRASVVTLFLPPSLSTALCLAPGVQDPKVVQRRAEPHREVERAGSGIHPRFRQCTCLPCPREPSPLPFNIWQEPWARSRSAERFSFGRSRAYSAGCRHGMSSGKHTGWLPMVPARQEDLDAQWAPARARLWAPIHSWPHVQSFSRLLEYLPALKRAQTSPHGATG